jgi:RNA polymerase sigma-70 factor, ECF subfamily
VRAVSIAPVDETADNSRTEVAQAPEASDVELVARAVGGEELAFEELFHRHRRRVALIAGRFFRQREQVEEVVQESFTKAFFALSDFSSRREASFASWIARIAFNSCYDELRRLKRRPEGALGEVTEEETARLRERVRSDGGGRGVESEAVSRDLASKLLARLGPEDRLVLVMLDAEGLSVAEIAELLGWSVSKVKVRAHRARARLRRSLARFL